VARRVREVRAQADLEPPSNRSPTAVQPPSARSVFTSRPVTQHIRERINRKLDALGAAARRTLGPPVGTEVVDLATSRMSWVSEPHVDLVLDGMRVATLDAVVTVTFEITGLAVTVRGGALVGLAGGSGTASVSLAVEGQELLPSRSVQIAPAWLVPLTPPIRLAEHDPASTVVLPRARPADATIAP